MWVGRGPGRFATVEVEPSLAHARVASMGVAGGPRLEAPGVLHPVMARGLERGAPYRDDRERADCVGRVATRGEAGR